MAPLLDRAASIAAFCKRVLDRGEVPIPVIVAQLFDAAGEVLLEGGGVQVDRAAAPPSDEVVAERIQPSMPVGVIVLLVITFVTILVFALAHRS